MEINLTEQWRKDLTVYCSFLEIRDEFDNSFFFFFHEKECQYTRVQVNSCNDDRPSLHVDSNDSKGDNRPSIVKVAGSRAPALSFDPPQGFSQERLVELDQFSALLLSVLE